MKKNKYANHGKVRAGDEMYNFAMDRYNDLLLQAEESRAQISMPRSDQSTKKRSALHVFWQLFAQLF